MHYFCTIIHFAGNTQGFKIVVNPMLDAYIRGIAINSFWETGILVQLNYVESASPSDYITVSPGSHAWLSLSATLNKFKTYSTPLRYRPCRRDETLFYLSGRYGK